MAILVVKRDGSTESFDPAKIARVVTAAGLPEDKAETLAQTISTWTMAQEKNEITSIAIKDQMIVELAKVDELVANFYAWYEKTLEE